MTEATTTKPKFDMAERTERFAKNCRTFIKGVPKDISNIEDCKQLARSSGSVAANYLEAGEALSKKDFVMRSKICRKESRESKPWLKLISTDETLQEHKHKHKLTAEVYELVKIFHAIVGKSS